MNTITPTARSAALLLALMCTSTWAQTGDEPPRRQPREAASAPYGSSSADRLRRAEERLERRRRGEAPPAAAAPPPAQPAATVPVAATPEAFWDALNKRDAGRLEAILDADPTLVKGASPLGNPALHLAASPAIARLLLKAGADPDVQNKDGVTALQAAARASGETQRQVALVLLEAGARTDFKPGTISPLMRAAERGDRAVAEALLARGVAVDDGKAAGSDTPLIDAARGGHVALAELLLAKGASVNHKGTGGQTALARAAFNTHPEVVKLLLAHKADINAPDSGGSTALGYLLARRNPSPDEAQRIAATAALLRENGAVERLAASAGAATTAAQTTRPAAAPAANPAQRAIDTTRRAAAALKYELVSDAATPRGQRTEYAKGSPRVTLTTTIFTRSDGSVRLTGIVSSGDAGARREAIRQYRAVLLQLLGVDSPERAGFEIEGNIVE